MKNMTLLIVSLVLLSVTCACRGKTTTPRETATTSSRTPVSDFSLPDLDGNIHTLSSYKGRVVLVDFWATWCGPCRLMIPHAIELYNRYKNQGFVILGVGLDDETSLRDYARKAKITYPVLVGTNETGKAYGVAAIPTSLVLDKRGDIAYRHTGFYPGMETTLEEEIKRLLTEK